MSLRKRPAHLPETVYKKIKADKAPEDVLNGLLDACIFPRVNLWTLLRCAPGFLLRKKLPERVVHRLRAEKFDLTSETPAAFELDGEWVGNLPATFSVERQKLRVVIP